jgi:hypothetical protein
VLGARGNDTSPHKNHHVNEILHRKGEIGKPYSMHRDMANVYKILVGNPEGKRPL